MSTLSRVTLKSGTLVHVGGVPAHLVGDTEVETASADLVVAHTGFREYPKMVRTRDGVEKVVASAEEEALWCDAPPADPLPDVLDDPDGVPPSPLDDIALDGAATNDGHVPEQEPDEKPEPKKPHASHGGAKKK